MHGRRSCRLSGTGARPNGPWVGACRNNVKEHAMRRLVILISVLAVAALNVAAAWPAVA